MAFSRRLGVIGIVGASWLVAVGCGSDDNKQVNTGDAGDAGESAGGKASSGGSNSNAGKGGSNTAGKGGSGGVGGKNAGGTGGTGGATAGTGGSGGTQVGEAGQGGTPVGESGGAGGAPDTSNAGAGGDAAGAGGQGPAAVVLACGNQCENDDDCAVDGAIVQMTCDLTSKRCVDPSVTACATPDDCTASASLWTFAPCATGDDCDPGYECIDWQGAGYCAYTPDPDCGFGDVKITLGQFGLPDSPVDVCYTPQACVAGACQPGCELGGCDGGGTGDTCSATTHQCECELGTECSVTGVCGADHHCTECKIDDDCPAGITGKDKCVNGKCGCSGAAACPDLTASATPVCE
jgi:hypothetical protein